VARVLYRDTQTETHERHQGRQASEGKPGCGWLQYMAALLISGHKMGALHLSESSAPCKTTRGGETCVGRVPGQNSSCVKLYQGRTSISLKKSFSQWTVPGWRIR